MSGKEWIGGTMARDDKEIPHLALRDPEMLDVQPTISYQSAKIEYKESTQTRDQVRPAMARDYYWSNYNIDRKNDLVKH